MVRCREPGEHRGGDCPHVRAVEIQFGTGGDDPLPAGASECLGRPEPSPVRVPRLDGPSRRSRDPRSRSRSLSGCDGASRGRSPSGPRARPSRDCAPARALTAARTGRRGSGPRRSSTRCGRRWMRPACWAAGSAPTDTTGTSSPPSLPADLRSAPSRSAPIPTHTTRHTRAPRHPHQPKPREHSGLPKSPAVRTRVLRISTTQEVVQVDSQTS